MKQCSKCGEMRLLDQYYTHGKTKDGRQSSCKVCCGKIQRPHTLKWHGSNKWSYKPDGYYTIYLLPTEWYVGVTGNIKQRLLYHKSINKRDISHWVILAEVDTKPEALGIEKHYHDRGYNGSSHTPEIKAKRYK